MNLISKNNEKSLDKIPLVMTEKESEKRIENYLRFFIYFCTFFGIAILCIGIIYLTRQNHTVKKYNQTFCGMSQNSLYNYKGSKIIMGGSFGEENDEVKDLQSVLDIELKSNEIKINKRLLGNVTNFIFGDFVTFKIPSKLTYGRFIHDFNYNKTAIIDEVGNLCFVLPLEFKGKPIIGNKNDPYDINIDEVRHETRVVLPALKKLCGYGFYITRFCEDKVKFLLEKVSTTKRSVATKSEEPFHYAEILGKNVIKYNIQNLKDIK